MQWYSATQVAKLWKAAVATVIGQIEDGTLGAVNIARAKSKRRRWRISEKHLADFEAARQNEKPTAPAGRSSRRTIAKPTKDYFATTGGGK